jgi:nucleolar protein 4
VAYFNQSKHKSKEVKEGPKPKATQAAAQKAPLDSAAIRTIIVSGLPENIDSKQLWKKIRKFEGAEKLDWPHKTEDGTEHHGVGMLSP